jgi:hypothetical protein
MNLQPTSTASAQRRIEWLLFATAFFAFAYFHQGGQWNQNGRFAMVRAMVEEHRFTIDSYLIYQLREGQTVFDRVAVRDGVFASKGEKSALGWATMPEWQIVSINPSVAEDIVAVQDITGLCATADVTYERGHFYPNKAPGTSFLATPAYFVIYNVEKLCGATPDDWWTLTLNAWLTTVFSVGLMSALGCVIFFRLAFTWSERIVPSLLAALTFGFGTLFFPYATMLYEHNISAVALLLSFYFLYVSAKDRAPTEVSTASEDNGLRLRLLLAGFCAGFAAITTYIVALIVVLLGGYLLRAVRKRGVWLWYGLGVLGPFLLICAHNFVCFGTPFTTNYSHQNPMFVTEGDATLGVFVGPAKFGGHWLTYLAYLLKTAAVLLFSPFRGLFFGSPVLLFGVVGLVQMFREKTFRREAILCGLVCAVLLAVNTSYNGWHGGWTTGPRYLIPALPFLALPMVFGFVRFPKMTGALAALSVAIGLLATAVNPQSPLGIYNGAKVLGKPRWQHNQITEYLLPMFIHGQLTTIIREIETILNEADHDKLLENNSRLISNVENELGGAAVVYGEPVSANQVGFYETLAFSLFPRDSAVAHRNSFNVGEFVFPQSRLSLLPLLAIGGLLIAVMLWIAVKTRDETTDRPSDGILSRTGAESDQACQTVPTAATAVSRSQIRHWCAGLGLLVVFVATYWLMSVAIAHCKQTANRKSGIALAHFTLANALRAEGKFDEAIAHYREVLRLAPDNAEHTATWAVCISPKESWTKQSLISPRR